MPWRVEFITHSSNENSLWKYLRPNESMRMIVRSQATVVDVPLWIVVFWNQLLFSLQSVLRSGFVSWQLHCLVWVPCAMPPRNSGREALPDIEVMATATNEIRMPSEPERNYGFPADRRGLAATRTKTINNFANNKRCRGLCMSSGAVISCLSSHSYRRPTVHMMCWRRHIYCNGENRNCDSGFWQWHRVFRSRVRDDKICRTTITDIWPHNLRRAQNVRIFKSPTVTHAHVRRTPI